MSSDFFNTPKIATKEDCSMSWNCGDNGKYFRCSICAHKFVPGDSYTLVYTNDLPGYGGNPICCTSHGDVASLRSQWISICEEWKALRAAPRFWTFQK